MLRKRKKSVPRQIDKIIEIINNDEPISMKKLKGGIALDMLDELQKLDGEAYIRSAAIVFDALSYVSTST